MNDKIKSRYSCGLYSTKDNPNKIGYSYTKTIYYEHDWIRKDNGEIDEFGFEYNYHNGPACKRCDYSFCIHCDPKGYNDKECIVEKEEYICPHCEGSLKPFTWNSDICKYCPLCGKPIEWPTKKEIKKIKEKSYDNIVTGS